MGILNLAKDEPKVDPVTRARQLYNQELKKGVELGRKLGKLQSNVATARNAITDKCHAMRLKQNMAPTERAFVEFRNIVRMLKGKNLL